MKTCKYCGLDKPRYRNSGRCYECHKSYQREYMRWHRRKSHSFFSKELFEIRFAQQGYVCAICGTDENTKETDWCADHDHDLNKPRGILCDSCNVALGHIERNKKEFIKKAITYLEFWETVN